jgi:hypothetical protein
MFVLITLVVIRKNVLPWHKYACILQMTNLPLRLTISIDKSLHFYDKIICTQDALVYDINFITWEIYVGVISQRVFKFKLISLPLKE